MAWRNIVTAVAVAWLMAAATAHSYLDRLDGFSIDTLFWLRHQLYGPLHGASQSPSTVIAIDEETYRRPPFEDLPKALWTPQLAKVIEATLDAGALVIGQDVILPTSVEGFVRGYDRDYLLALRKGGRQGRLLLGKVQHLKKPISPFPGHSFAVGNERNMRLVNLYRDPDDVIRRVPLRFRSKSPDGERRVESSMALELAARALGETPLLREGEPIVLDGYEIPGSAGNSMLLNFETGGTGIPVYSLADLNACIDAGDSAFFRRHFEGKVVLIGSVLDVEDRKITSQRFVTGPDGAWLAERCHYPVMQELYGETVVRSTVPGTFLFATAVNNLLRRDALAELPSPANTAITLALALVAAAAVLLLRPGPAATVLALGAVAWVVLATVVFRQGTVLPLLDPLVAGAATFAALLGYRFGVSDREKRHLRRAFAYYLPAPVIERMLRGTRPPRLGGETRELTVLFSDIAGFTELCEGLAPQEVVELMNRYLSAMTDIIEDHGGFVDKYIGDAIVAVFGAPLDDPDHARHGVEAALACQRKLEEIAPDLGLPEGRRLASRIGVNSGPVLIGNIGSKRRFNYTVMGDAVNLAARLEGANKVFGSAILVSETTAGLCGEEIAFREVGRVRVLGRREAVTLCEPLGPACQLDREQAARQQAFERAQCAFRGGDFAGAANAFEALATGDPVAAALAARARDLEAVPPEAWEGITDLERK